MSKIAWNGIIKNEAKVLPRLLESIYPIIDYYCIIDTGSTDESKKIIKDFFDSKGIEGEIHDHPFVNFEDARNFALNKLKESGKADYGIIVDADEQLNIESGFNIDEFKKLISGYDIGSIEVYQKNTKFSRRFIFNISKPFKWKGKLHNVLICNSPVKEYFIKNQLSIKVNTDGHTWTKQGQREKYLTHAGILEKEVAESNKPRDIFYLAQSYRDAFEPEKAIEWYRKRVFRNDGFYEEVYYSQFMIGNLYSSIGESEKAIIEWMKCFEIDLLRAEHILNMIIEHQKLGLWKMAYIFSKIGMEEYHGKNPYPKRVLFIDEPTYSHKLKDLYENLSEKIEA